jgi:outer membrane protein W
MKAHWTLGMFAVAMSMLIAPSMTSADELSGHVSGLIGVKAMDSTDWPDLDSHFAMGVLFDIKKDSWPVSMVLDLTDTGDKHKHDGMEDLGHTTELSIGVRKFFVRQDSKIQPYVGGGVSSIYAEQEFEVNDTTTKDDENNVGIWLGAGLYYRVKPRFVIGLDVRYSDAEATLFDEDLEAGGIQTGLTAGFQF